MKLKFLLSVFLVVVVLAEEAGQVHVLGAAVVHFLVVGVHLLPEASLVGQVRITFLLRLLLRLLLRFLLRFLLHGFVAAEQVAIAKKEASVLLAEAEITLTVAAQLVFSEAV